MGYSGHLVSNLGSKRNTGTRFCKTRQLSCLCSCLQAKRFLVNWLPRQQGMAYLQVFYLKNDSRNILKVTKLGENQFKVAEK